MTITQFIVPIIIGLATGMITYLTASGMSLIMSGMGTINFSQGAFYVVGATLCYFVAKSLPFWLALVVGFGVPFLIGGFIEFLLRPVFGKDMNYSMMVTLGITYIMIDAMVFIWGQQLKSNKVPAVFNHPLIIGSVIIPIYYIFIIAFSVVVAIAFWIMFYKTKLGMYFRAIISDRGMVENLGINVQLMYSLMFMIGTGLAGIAGALNSPLEGFTPAAGMTCFANVFPVLLVGGINNMKGALPAALILGVLGGVAAIFLPMYYNLVPAVVMVLVMFFKPDGLFTRKEA